MGGPRRGRSKEGFRHNAVNSAAHHSGIGSLKKQGSEPAVFSDSLSAAEQKRSMSKKACGTPMKRLIEEEISTDVIARHTSPGIIGRLMGLETLPSFGVHNQHNKYATSRSQRMSPGGSNDRYGFSEDIPCRSGTDKMPEFKDVFEVMETTRMKLHRSPKSRYGNVSSRADKVDSADLDFIGQKFMDAKRLSTDESLQRSKEFNDALEALVSNRDLLLEFLQESNPVPTNDLTDLSCSPSSIANHITILKPSRRNKFIDADITYPQEKATESYLHARKDVKHSSSKPYANFFSQSLQEDTGSLTQNLPRSNYKESIDKRVCPTRIVVLKPSLEKAQNMEGVFPLTHEMFHSDYRRPKVCQDLHIQSPYTEESMPQMPSRDSKALGPRAKGSREIAREVTKQMRRAAKGGGSGNQLVKPEIKTFGRDEGSHVLSSVAKLNTLEAFHRSSNLHDVCAPPSFSSSPTYSTGKSVGKEAKKRLSNRWKMTCQYQHPAPDADGFSTLEDMLALSDREASKLASGSVMCRKCPKGELQRDGMPGLFSFPLGISSNDGWKDGTLSNLTRSKSIPSSSSNQVSPKSSSRKRSGRHNEFSKLKGVLKAGPFDAEDTHHRRERRSPSRSSTLCCDEAELASLNEAESMLTECEIHVNSEGLMSKVAVPETSEERLVHSVNFGYEFDAQCYHLGTSLAAPECQDEALSTSIQSQQKQLQPASEVDDRLLVPSPDDLSTQAQGIDQHQDGIPNACNPSMELEYPVSSNEDEQPSPVSVLGSSLDAEDGYSGGFEKISADLQELRMQLRLLKMETMDDAEETELLVFNDDEIASSGQPLPEMEELSFRDEDERDFCYLLDILINLGIHTANHEEFLNVCHAIECPAGPDVFNRLEKKYSKFVLWPQSERKLLFDLTNAVLADLVASLVCRSSQGMWRSCSWPRWDEEGLVRDVWQRVARQRRAMECKQEDGFMDVGWLGSEDGIDLVASEIGSVLHEGFLEEIIADLLV